MSTVNATYTPEKFENATITASKTLEYIREHAHNNHHIGRHFGFAFEAETRADKSRDYRDVIVFEKRFPSTLKRKAPFSNSVGVVWTGP